MWLHTLFLLATTMSAFTATTAFDAPLVTLALNISQAAYCLPDTEGPNAWDCVTCTPEVTHATALVTRGELAVFGYIAARDALFVGYRGSTNIQNWIDNLHVRQESPYRDANVGVEHGMYSIYASMRVDVRSILNKMVAKYGTNHLLLTGHSLGGALATLTAFDLLYAKAPFVVDDLITFGSPRVGNEQFAQYFDHFDVRITRVTHYRDMVPHVPEMFLGYAHVRGEIWYNEPSTTFTECTGGEDPNCSNSCAPIHCTSISNHLLYLDVAMGSDGTCYAC